MIKKIFLIILAFLGAILMVMMMISLLILMIDIVLDMVTGYGLQDYYLEWVRRRYK